MILRACSVLEIALPPRSRTLLEAYTVARHENVAGSCLSMLLAVEGVRVRAPVPHFPRSSAELSQAPLASWSALGMICERFKGAHLVLGCSWSRRLALLRVYAGIV